MKKQNIIIIIVFGALIFGLGLLGWLTPDQAFSENENRYLQELPKLSEDTMVNGDFGDEVEDYLSDQFWQRDSWTAARSKMKMLLRNKDIGGVYLCKDGYYIEKVTQTDVDEARLQKNLQTVKDFFTRCEEKGLAAENLTFMPVPTPGYTLRDKLPRYATLFDEDAVFDEMKLVFDDQLVDLRTDFAKAAESEQLYYRTDHHWKTAGALLGYQCYRAAMGLSIPAAADYTVERYEGFRGTLYSKVLDKNAATDTVELYHRKGDAALTVTYDNADHASCYDMEKLQQKDVDAWFYAAIEGFQRELPKHFAKKLYFAENWEDAPGFEPYVYVDVSDGYALWEKAIDHHWFAVHSTSFPYKEYYSHLKRLRGIQGRKGYCECFMIPKEQYKLVQTLENL